MKARITQQDSKLEHQIILRWADRGNHSKIAVSCNCLPKQERMGEIDPGTSPWKLYNDPDNHNGEFRPGLSTARVFNV